LYISYVCNLKSMLLKGKQLVFLLLIFLPQLATSQSISEEKVMNDTVALYENFFAEHEPITLTLKFDIKTYQRTRKSEEYQPAELIYQFDDSTSLVHKVKLKTRGEFRKNYCSIPPFWLNIKRADLPHAELDAVTKMKVVTHCKNSDKYSDYLLKEYLAYKIYNIISPYSFRVRLIRMIYIDTGRENKRTENWAFAIEPEELMEERLDAAFIENDRLAMATVNSGIMDQLAMFQYMIGNSDYSVTGRHNLKILNLYSSGPVGNIPVPYDFDYTGIVNASYAIPSENLGIESVTDRYFLGPCRKDNVFLKVIAKQNNSKSEILTLLHEFEYISQKHKQEIINYIDSYYTELESPKFIDRNIRSTCR
jgi:hypothetical protein